MKKNVFILVIFVITIALLGLIGIQLYWIRNAFSLKETSFNRGVSEAISSAIYKYNKLEMAKSIVSRQEENEKVESFFKMLDSLNQDYYRDVMEAIERQHAIDDQLLGWQSEHNYQYINPQSSPGINIVDTLLNPRSQDASRGYARRSTPDVYDAFHDFFSRSKMVNDLFDDLFSNRYNYSPSAPSGFKLLDSLVVGELHRQGINTQYEIGVYDPLYNALLAERTGRYTDELLESAFVFSLFPNDIFRNPEFLFVFFPYQKRYLLTQMNFMTGMSAMFILVIISSFTYTIITIIRQKKLSLIKNDFINNMTHELKTPISTISLACQALRDKDVQKSETLYQSYINVINEENQRLGMMTEKVLQTAQLEKGKLKLKKEGFNLHDLIEDAVKKIDLQLKTRNGNITKQLYAEFSYMEADKMHLTNLVFNLLDNAIKYSPDKPEISILTENSENGIILHVVDKGEGISKINQKKIFDKLYRISTGNVHNVKGFGLGLSYVKAIAEMHGGEVRLRSELKKGSTFSVHLPFGTTSIRKNQ